MVDKGYAAVSARRVAAAAGVKPALVQYYFPTMDELLIALYRRSADQVAERHAQALASPRPLHALWALSTDPARTALALEFMALSNHRKTIRAEIAGYLARSRSAEVDAAATLLRDRGVDPADLPAGGLGLLLGGAGRALVMEHNMGFTAGHEEARAIVERWLETIEPSAAT
jgi:AcrR family transcriptional regulator